MNDKVITLPNHEEMLGRLLKISDETHLKEGLYPILLESAGQTRVAGGVVITLALAIHDYTEGLPPAMANLLYKQVPDFIDALIDDKEVAEQAKKFFQEAITAAKKQG